MRALELDVCRPLAVRRHCRATILSGASTRTQRHKQEMDEAHTGRGGGELLYGPPRGHPVVHHAFSAAFHRHAQFPRFPPPHSFSPVLAMARYSCLHRARTLSDTSGVGAHTLSFSLCLELCRCLSFYRLSLSLPSFLCSVISPLLAAFLLLVPFLLFASYAICGDGL